MKAKYVFGLLLFISLFCIAGDGFAQCAMCKITAESGGQAAKSPVPGLNQGILYLAAVPYIAFGVIAFLFVRAYKKRKAEAREYGMQDF